jgi:lysophospholipase L1-like esterase
MRLLKLFTLFFLCVLNPVFLMAQDTIKKPDFGPYYLHRVEHFRTLPNDKGEIVFLGDSITDGAEWGELTQNLLCKNRGISGDNTAGVYYRLDEVTESKPARIFIMIGVNDLASGLTVENIMINYTRIIDVIKEQTPKTEIFIQSVLPVNGSFTGFKNHTNKTEQIIDLNTRLNKLALEKGCTYIDLFTPFASDNKLKKEFTEDGLHVNGEGYLLWYSIIKKWL